MSELPTYLANGAKCYMDNPLLPTLYLCCNIALNMSALATLRTLGATSFILGMSSVIPLTIWAFSFDLPVLGAAAPLQTGFFLGTALILLGLLVYNYIKLRPSPAPISDLQDS